MFKKLYNLNLYLFHRAMRILNFNLFVSYSIALLFIHLCIHLHQIKIFNQKYSTRIKGPKTPPAPELSDFQKEIIFGSMLGDLSAERPSLNGNTRLRFYMYNVNRDYINHLYSIFEVYVKTPPKELNRKINKLTKGIHTDIYFSTLRYSFFNWVVEDFYI